MWSTATCYWDAHSLLSGVWGDIRSAMETLSVRTLRFFCLSAAAGASFGRLSFPLSQKVGHGSVFLGFHKAGLSAEKKKKNYTNL